jgi:hypothetical protein
MFRIMVARDQNRRDAKTGRRAARGRLSRAESRDDVVDGHARHRQATAHAPPELEGAPEEVKDD